jgi:peptide chain release factor 2
LWENPGSAQSLLGELARLKQEVAPWQTLQSRIEELSLLADLALQEHDEATAAEAEHELERASNELSELETRAFLSGEYADHNTLLSINAGAGGTEACDWVDMLARMYLRWAERQGFETEIIDRTPGETAGSKSVTMAVTGPYSYGYLEGERGVHRLVRISPFDASKRRHTTFASVDVIPDVQESDRVDIDPEDLEIDFYRASSAGGQHVNKVATAVRIKHIPTGIVATCQNERSQHKNRQMATRVLAARVLDLQRRQQEQKLAEIRGEQTDIAWGNQIRSYVLHPYTMVKDHRTDAQTSNGQAVLDGEIDQFVKAYLEHRAGEKARQKPGRLEGSQAEHANSTQPRGKQGHE